MGWLGDYFAARAEDMPDPKPVPDEEKLVVPQSLMDDMLALPEFKRYAERNCIVAPPIESKNHG